MQPAERETEVQLHIWGWSSMGESNDDTWRCEYPDNVYHPFGHRLYDGTMDDIVNYELWQHGTPQGIPYWWILQCAPDLVINELV